MQLTTNTQAFIDAEVYSTFIIENLDDGLLPASFSRNITDFPNGTTLNIKTVGTVAIQEVEEDVPISYTPIDTGTIQMRITDYIGDGWFVTDKLREDGSQVETLMAMRAQESTRAIQEVVETRAFSVLQAAQTNANPNVVNGFAHRIAAAAPGNTMVFKDIVKLKLAFDKANVPGNGRVLIVDPIAEATLNGLVSYTSEITPYASSLLENGWAANHKFVNNIMGFDIFTSNRLPRGTFSDGTTVVTDGVANLAMCLADDNTKALMQAWRRMPKVEGDRNKDFRRDEFNVTARFGFGVQRLDTLGVLITSATNF